LARREHPARKEPTHMKKTTITGTARWAILALLTLTLQPLAAQDAANQPAEAVEEQQGSSAFFEQVAVDIVNVEVYVTDKSGEPVSGLTIEDFEITEDDRPVEILNFYHVSEGRPVVEYEPTEEAAEVAEPATLEYPDSLEPRIPDSQRLHLIIYVDNSSIHPLNRNRAFARLRDFLSAHVDSGDQVMVASFDRSLHVRQPFTESATTVNSVLLDLEKLTGLGNEREAERSDALKEIYETDSLHTAKFRAKQFADAQFNQVSFALDALRDMIDSLGAIPGRKMLVHLSDGVPMVPGQDLYQAIQQNFQDLPALGEAFSRDLSRRYMEIISHANSNRISFYTIDAGGLRTRSGMSAENATIESQVPVAMAVDGVRASNLQGTLKLMADRTGGQAIVNTNDIMSGLRRMASDFDNYYSLGYRAPEVNRGRYHRIEVKLKGDRPGLKIRHREGYRDKSLQTQIEDGARAFLIHGYETNPLGASIEFGEITPGADGTASVPIRVRVPLKDVVLLPRGDHYEARLRLYFGATDEAGRDVPLQELPFELRIPGSSVELARQDEVARVIDATMRRGPHKLVIVVRDEISEERSVLGRYLTIGGP
jgi:VWFA-related protein